MQKDLKKIEIKRMRVKIEIKNNLGKNNFFNGGLN